MDKRRLIFTGFSGLLFLFTAYSCVKEDQSDYCEDVVSNSFRVYYDYSQTSRSGSYETAELLHLYVFDEQGYLLDIPYEDVSPRVGETDYYTELDLEPGEYHFVVWGNLTGCYYVTPSEPVPGVTHYDDIMVHLERDENNSVTSDPHNLYFGDFLGKTVTGQEEERVDIEIVRNTYRINVFIDDPDNVIPEDTELTLVITDKNGSFRFDNTVLDDEDLAELSYSMTFESGQTYKFETSLSLVRLEYERSTMFRLYNSLTGELVYEDDLIDMIQNAEIDLVGEFEFDILLQIRGGKVYITINGWEVTLDDNQVIFG